jgi:hypothetical protein
MTPTLKQVMEQAEKLDPDTREAVAKEFQRFVDLYLTLSRSELQVLMEHINQIIESALANQRWEQAFSDQRGLDALHRMAQEAVAEDERGETEEGGFGE